MAGYRTVRQCRLCDSEALSEVLNLGETPLANELDGDETFPLVVMRCDSCEHHQLSIAIAAERLWGPNYPYQSGTSPVFRKHLEELADEVAAMKPGGRVLEIASNDGTLVKLLATRGMKAIGTDPSGPLQLSEEDSSGGFSRLVPHSWPPGPSDAAFSARFFGMHRIGGKEAAAVILALNVFAHVDDLHGFTAAVKEALAPDGVFILEVGYLPDVIERGYFDVIYHEHMSYHHIAPLVGFFRRHGLYLSKVKHNKSQGGSIRCYVTHDHKDGGDLPHEEYPRVAALAEKIRERKAVLKDALVPLEGKRVAVYGCPAKLTTLLYGLGLEEYPFDCVGDDNPLKVGRRTPGGRFPIVSVDEMLAREPDSILIASWNFAPDICSRLRGRGFKGGIINPMSHR